MKAMMTAMMTAAVKRCLFIFLPSACLRAWAAGLGSRHWGFRGWGGGGGPSPERAGGPAVAPGPLLLLLPKAQDQGTWGARALGWGSLRATSQS